MNRKILVIALTLFGVGLYGLMSEPGRATASGTLTPNELASIRGATGPSGCVQSAALNGCINPAGWTIPSGCVGCSNKSQLNTWPDSRKAAPAPSYATPADPCPANTATAYANATYTTCGDADNNLLKNSGTMNCTWTTNCTNGPTVQDAWCNGNTTKNAPPSAWTGTGFGPYTRYCYAARVCSTGTAAAPPPNLITVNWCNCVPPAGG